MRPEGGCTSGRNYLIATTSAGHVREVTVNKLTGPRIDTS